MSSVDSVFRFGFLFAHDLFGKPVAAPDQVRSRLLPDHALRSRHNSSNRPKRQTQSTAPTIIGADCAILKYAEQKERRNLSSRFHAVASSGPVSPVIVPVGGEGIAMLPVSVPVIMIVVHWNVVRAAGGRGRNWRDGRGLRHRANGHAHQA